MYGMTRPTPENQLRLMSAEPDWLLVDRHLSGECTADEQKAIDAWIAADPSHAQLIASMRRVWTEAATPLPHVDEKAAWLALQARRDVAKRPARAGLAMPPSLRKPAEPRFGWRARALAAGLVAAVALGAAGWWKHTQELQVAEVVPPREYITERGQRAEVTLIDGTRVWLSADTKMQVPQSYGAMTRDVMVDGEAYFIVQHDAKRPFRVHAGGSVSEDLGTEFDVRAYPSDSGAIVIVSSGRVALHHAAASGVQVETTQLSRGQMGRLDRNGAVSVVDSVDVDGSLAWRKGRLAFEERPLRDVARELERWYDIDIALDDSVLASTPLTASFTNQSADQALSIVAGALGAHYARDGRTVRFTTARP
jgi:ferric-dicitrate binding protein FerR (iron transport regulator)